MDGLECSEILLSQVRQYEPFRIDSHFYEKQYRTLKETLSSLPCSPLKDLVKKTIQTGHTPSMAIDSYYGGNIALIKTDNLHDNSVGTIFTDYLSAEGNAVISRTALSARDIITTIIGATEKIIARSAIVTEEYLPANINQNIVQIRVNPQKAAPEYVNTFLNTKYGKQYLIYLSRQTEQYNLNCKEVELVLIPLLSEKFQNEVAKVVCKASEHQIVSRSLFRDASVQLDATLNVHVSEQKPPVLSIRQVSESFCITGRIDAEYYQPKYEEIARIINTTETVSSLCNVHDDTFIPQDDTEYYYIELANVGCNGDVDGVELAQGRDLPSRARRIVRSGQIVISSVEGSLQSCALIEDKFDGALCSTGFYILDSDVINSETLLVLFKSEPIQALLKQRCSGTILTAITKDELLSMPLPKIDTTVQEAIAEKVQESFALRRKSKELLEYAKKAVEMAIEQGEDVAIAWLKEMV